MCQHPRVAVFWLTLIVMLAVPALAATPKASTPSTSQSSAKPTAISLQVQRVSDGSIGVTAIVLDAKKMPVAGTAVSFKARTMFGWLDLAEASTDANGTARMTLPPTFRATEIAAEAGEGDGVVQSARWLGGSRPIDARVRPGREALSLLSPQPGFISPYPVPIQVAFLGLILGGIWTTFAYLVSLLVRIRRAG